MISRVYTISFTSWSLTKWWPLKATLSGPYMWSSEGLGHDCTNDAPEPQSSISTEFQQCGLQCEDGHCYATMQHLLTVVLGLWSSTDFFPWFIFSPQKLNQCTLFFFGEHGKGSGHVDTATTTQLTVQCRNCFSVRQSPCL